MFNKSMFENYLEKRSFNKNSDLRLDIRGKDDLVLKFLKLLIRKIGNYILWKYLTYRNYLKLGG